MSAARASATSATTEAQPDEASRQLDLPPADRGATPLERLVADPARFAETEWGRLPVVERGRAGLVELFTIDDVDGFIARGVRRPAVRMVRAGEILEPTSYCTTTRLGGQSLPEVVDGLKVAEQLVAGATLVVQSLHRQWDPLVDFADELMAEIGHPVQINAYLTPRSASGLRTHRDEHDVFVVQLDGAKEWTVDGLGDVVLEPGDVLYIPAGCDHSAVTTEDLSLHLTIGVLRITYRAVLQRVLDGDEFGELDAPLPLAFRSSTIAPDDRSLEIGVARMLNTVVHRLRSTKVSDVVDRERRRQLVPYSRRGHLRSVLTADELSLDSMLRWVTVLPRMQPAYDDDGTLERERVRVLLADRILRVPRVAVPAIDAISRAGDTARVGDLPGLDPSSRLVIARRLVVEGACVIVAD